MRTKSTNQRVQDPLGHGMNSRWRKGAVRYSAERTVEHTRHVRQADGRIRRETEAVTEPRFVERAHEGPEWRKGARIRKRS